MAIPVIPAYPPFRWPATQSFTYGDFHTNQLLLEGLRKYIQDELVPWIDENIENFGEDVRTRLNAAITTINTAIREAEQTFAEQAEEQNAAVSARLAENLTRINAAVRTVIEAHIDFTDPVVKGVWDARETFRAALDGAYANKSTQTIVETGRLSKASLDDDYPAKSIVETGRLSQAALDERHAAKSTQTTVEEGRLSRTNLDTYYADSVHDRTTVVGKALRDTYGVTTGHFGIKGDGSDETAAFQAFVTHVVTNGLEGIVTVNEVRISAAINVPRGRGWRIKGQGPYNGTNIVQTADNVPILRFTDTGSVAPRDWAIEDICFTYQTLQPYTNTAANCIYFETMVYEFVFRRVYFRGGRYGLAYKPEIGGAWGGDWDAIQFGQMSGGWYDMSRTINSVPNNRFGRIFGDAATCQDYLFKQFRGYNSTIDTIEVINYDHGLGAGFFDFSAGASFHIGAFKMEGGKVLKSADLVRIPANSFITFGEFRLQGSNGGLILNPVSGEIRLFVMGAGGDNQATLRIGLLAITGEVLNTYILAGGHFFDQVIIDRINYDGGWKLANTPGGTALTQNVQIETWMNKRMSPNKGDVDVTIVPGDETTMFFQTPFTAPRTVNLPSDVYNLIGGLKYRFYLAANVVNGTNTFTIMADTRVVYTKDATNTQIITVEWRRHTSGPGGWFVTDVSSV